MKWVGIFQVGIFWVEIFRGGDFPEGSLMGGNFPEENFPRGNFPRTVNSNCNTVITILFKGALSGLRQFSAIESPLKMMRNTLSFT